MTSGANSGKVWKNFLGVILDHGIGTGTGPRFMGMGRDQDQASRDQEGSGMAACRNGQEPE